MRYIDKPYGKRQFLMVVEDDRGTANDTIDVFRKSELPQGVHFGLNAVNKNELYIAHPSEKGLYIPYVKHEISFFQDKIHELSILLQALGAEEINISWIKGMSLQDMEKSSFNLGGSGSAGKYGSGAADYSEQNYNSNTKSSKNGIMLTITSDSVIPPFVPSDLHWYEGEPTWKRMVQQRLLGMKTYSIEVSSKSSSESTSSSSESLKVALRVLFVKLKVNVSEQLERMLKEDEETVWKVDVKFKSLSSYTQTEVPNSNTNSHSRANSVNFNSFNNENAELNYRNSCIKLIKSRKIPDAVAIELNRIRDQLNLPISIAEQIEEEVKSNIKEPWYKRLF